MIQEKQDKPKSNFEKFMLIFALIEPLATIPQIYNIWIYKDTSGVSLVTWTFYSLTSFIWLLYGIKTTDKPIIASGALWSTTQILVVIGILVR